MAVKEIEMPHLGESVTEASISIWLVEAGDKIDKYDPIAEAISDKVTTEIPSNYTGTVKELLVDVEEDVAIGTPIMKIEVEEEEDTKETPEEEPKTTAIQEELASQAPRFSPAVLRLAQENNINLETIKGTGRNGRITRKDVARAVEQGPAPKETIPVEQTQKTEEEPIVRSIDEELRTHSQPADSIRKVIAKRMTESYTQIPHAWMMIEVDVTNLVKLREQTKETFKQKEGLSLSYFPFFVKAVVQALKNHPRLNTSWEDGNILFHDDLNISVAVATDEHLFVPVIRQADQYSVKGIAQEIHRLATAVRSGKLDPKDQQGGTITINSTGSFGSVQSMGIINAPQAAILQVESINKRFVPTEDGGFKAADMVNLCLSFDHRILDGLQAGLFLQEVKRNLMSVSNETHIY